MPPVMHHPTWKLELDSNILWMIEGPLKIKGFWRKAYDVLISVHDANKR